MDDDFEKELKTGFLEESTQLLLDAEQCFLALEANPSDPELLDKIFRLAHNLKGSAKAVGFMEVGEFTHQLESLLLKLKKQEIQVDASAVTLLLKCNDRLQKVLGDLKNDLGAAVDCSDLMREISDLLQGQTTSAPPAPAVESIEPPSPTEEETLTPTEVQQALLPSGPIQPEPILAPPPPEQNKPKASSAPASKDESIRVSLARLEKLMNNVGELVILQTVLNQQRLLMPSPLIQRTVVQLAKITKDIQDISMSLRMIPLKQTFQKMQRIVRDTSRDLGKEINFEITGDETEIDKTVVENLGDPLVHLVRNAVDHGIDSVEERLALGKPAAGSISLSAFHRGSQIVIEVRDDGKGLNPEVLKKKAIEKGIVHPNQALTEEQCYQLIFAPGFSTKSQVSDISGRGVGMDVVKTNIEKQLNGEVQLESKLGQGMCVRILLPLTLSIIDGMVIQCGDERHVVPIAQIQESIKPSKEEVHVFAGVGEILSVRGTNYPLFRLSNLLNRKVKAKPASECIAIIVHSGGSPFSVLIDEILGQQQVVIKQLGEELKGLKGVSGGAILGDGRAALILDLNELVGQALRKSSTSQTLRGAA